MNPKRVEETKIATSEDLSGHMNHDYTFPSVITPRGVLRDADTNWHLKEKIEIQDISADQHGSWVNDVMTPNHVTGFKYKVYGDA